MPIGRRRRTVGSTMKQTSDEPQLRPRPGAPPDSDLVGIPLVIGMMVALFAVIGAFWLDAWVGMVVLGIVLVVALVITYRVVASSETSD
jgi:hypothetical protein